MYFSEYFGIDHKLLDDYGAINISLIADIPLFIDPMLIFNSKKEKYKNLHKEIIKYMHFLAKKAEHNLTNSEIKTWFTFNEVPNNWLGFSMSGNKGQALDMQFAKALYDNISFVISNNNISYGQHFEKITLLYPNIGKDKISDMTVNLIKHYLCKYTEEFTLKYLQGNPNVRRFYVEKCFFNYKTESFESKSYFLPFIKNKHGKDEYILLTPKDILRYDEPSINAKDFVYQMDLIREIIDNQVLRTELDNYIQKAVREYNEKLEKTNKKISLQGENKIKKNAFQDFSKDHRELYDYYIKLREKESEQIKNESFSETELQKIKFIDNVELFVEELKKIKNSSKELDSYHESIRLINNYKECIKKRGCYKLFYDDNRQIISDEKSLQLYFKFVYYDSKFKIDSETDNGRGPADFVVSYGSNDSTVIEFKLASNRKLSHVFEQTQIYANANKTKNQLIVIFYFSENEYQRVMKLLKKANHENDINKNIVLIDCRFKESASKPNSTS